ncbi:UDP-N-acetylmuramoyl-tripeptide--D-alanyl-D-alanine ligase [Roseomonas aerophila]|uniref:UDP-N-acetylmuramoyl-tripeptide--D-alanyl-D-alanine ligase n=1 Tax=Teichococcus aerophilus TaxID=1224513 RepID=A0ABR7RTK0_9PROT|nr:UDP-N-acetylmuramoyl-tripeptide--D-alanyl-D-alanine ligase [Pseudoroseomonas aerophila]MBC9209897.1 UDP-N-acetylmuramoyl-tripeptide--D-alanyl-D-alanine ligase [Pseudoroseomonas aerophila]
MTTPLWTATELRDATGGALAGEPVVTGIAIDSRAVQPGDLFVALRDVRDGHDFVPAAFASGAAVAMIDRDAPGGETLRVADTLAGLAALGGAGRARSSARIAAITGSVGKTTTKDMLRHGLGSFGATHAAVASYNNHWGLPLTLARMPRGTEYGVLEIGMNHRGEIAPLARLAQPHVVAITQIGAAHIGHLGSLEEIAAEKADILEGLSAGGVAVLPRDGFFDGIAARARGLGASVIGVGEDAGADARLVSAECGPLSSTAEVMLHSQALRLSIGAPGRHLVLNALTALATAAALGVDAARFAASLSSFRPGAGRGARVPFAVPGGEALLLDESYNGQPPAMRAALAVLGTQQAARRLAVLGDMRELGDFGPALHEGLLPDVVGNADLVFCCGAQMRRLYDALPEALRGAHAETSEELAPLVRNAVRPGDVVLVKGSLGTRMAAVVGALKSQGAHP